jgi:hypothetical protein
MDKVPVKRNGEPDYRYKASNKVAAWCKVKDIETRAAYINSDGLKP